MQTPLPGPNKTRWSFKTNTKRFLSMCCRNSELWKVRKQEEFTRQNNVRPPSHSEGLSKVHESSRGFAFGTLCAGLSANLCAYNSPICLMRDRSVYHNKSRVVQKNTRNSNTGLAHHIFRQSRVVQETPADPLSSGGRL